jgi:hypothetical protein
MLRAMNDRWANWLKDGGRTIVFCGNPYEDDLESVVSVSTEQRQPLHG